MNIQELYNSSISTREEEILQLIAAENTIKEIATKLFISDHTVISHRKNLMVKMGAKNTAGLVRRAFEYGMLRIQSYVILLIFLLGGMSLSAQKNVTNKSDEVIPPSIGLEVSMEHIVLFGDSIAGGGDKMLWIPEKAAFRVGNSVHKPNNILGSDLVNTEYAWDESDLGRQSAAFGTGNKASGSNSMSWGLRNEADYDQSTAWGSGNVVKANNSTVWGNYNSIDSSFCATAWGSDNNVSGWYSTVWGKKNTIKGELATAWGEDNQANGERTTVWGNSNIVNPASATAWGTNNSIEAENAFNSTAWGLNNTVEGDRATAWGSNNTASARGATSWGNNNTASGISSTVFGSTNESKGGTSLAIGTGNIANGYGTTTMGVYAKPIGQELVMSGIPTPIAEDYPLFVIGNGSLNVFDINAPFRSNAVVVSKSGRVGINKQLALPIADLHIKSSEPYTGASVPNRSTGGIVMEDANSDAFWQINIANGDLHFSRGDVLKARLLDDGTWQANDFRDDVILSSRINNVKKHVSGFEKISIGRDTKGKVVLDAPKLLKTHPEFVSFDDDGKPQSIDYKQLYLLAINEIQEQAKVIIKQTTKLTAHDDRIAKLEELIKDK